MFLDADEMKGVMENCGYKKAINSRFVLPAYKAPAQTAPDNYSGVVRDA